MNNRQKNHSILKITLTILALFFFTSGCEKTLTNSLTTEKESSDPNLNSNYLEAVSEFSDIAATDKPTSRQKQEISVTILYDNYVSAEGLRSDWGFSCILKGKDKTILFDTGTNSELLLENMEKLKVNPKDVEVVVISHYHGDHTGGLFSFLEKNSDVSIYLPSSGSDRYIQDIKRTEAKIVTTDAPIEICKGVHLTGQMGEQIIEQSMIVDTADGGVLITGCSHPGIVDIVRKSKAILSKDIQLVFGGFHLTDKSEAELKEIISDLKKLGVVRAGPTHCTGDIAIKMFKQAFGQNFLQLGVGQTIKLEVVSD